MTSANPSLAIAGRQIGPGHPCLVIGEVAQAHDGSLGAAHAFVDTIANAGAGAVKFQAHIAAAESTAHEPWRVKLSRQGERQVLRHSTQDELDEDLQFASGR